MRNRLRVSGLVILNAAAVILSAAAVILSAAAVILSAVEGSPPNSP